MRPIPVAFHIWFLEIHTYGIGLALTFWFGLRYTERRLRRAGYRWEWVTGMFVWVIVAAVLGARAMHVLASLSYYSHHPGQVLAIWQGGLSSFGGLLAAVPVAIISSRRRCPELASLRFADLMAPVLMACWGLGRLLGPQLMVAGGGHPTHQWFGMYYAGQPGKRLPVPIFQSIEDFTIFGILLLVERWLRQQGPAPRMIPVAVASGASSDAATVGTAGAPSTGTPAAGEGGDDGDGSDQGAHDAAEEGGTVAWRPDPATLPPAGIVLGVGMVLWGIERFADEHLWLGEDGHLGSVLVQLAGVGLAVVGLALLASRWGALSRYRRRGADPGGGGDDPAETSVGEAGPTTVEPRPADPRAVDAR